MAPFAEAKFDPQGGYVVLTTRGAFDGVPVGMDIEDTGDTASLLLTAEEAGELFADLLYALLDQEEAKSGEVAA